MNWCLNWRPLNRWFIPSSKTFPCLFCPYLPNTLPKILHDHQPLECVSPKPGLLRQSTNSWPRSLNPMKPFSKPQNPLNSKSNDSQNAPTPPINSKFPKTQNVTNTFQPANLIQLFGSTPKFPQSKTLTLKIQVTPLSSSSNGVLFSKFRYFYVCSVSICFVLSGSFYLLCSVYPNLL